jgi:hypothetical protein
MGDGRGGRRDRKLWGVRGAYGAMHAITVLMPVVSPEDRVYLAVSANGRRRRTIQRFVTRVRIDGSEISAEALDLTPPLLRVQFRDSTLGN